MLLADTLGIFSTFVDSCSKLSGYSLFSMPVFNSWFLFKFSFRLRSDNSRSTIASISSDSLSDGSTNIRRFESVLTKI